MSIEDLYVKNIYNKIAYHFDNTRYRPWSCVENFLNSVPKKSLIGDIGCGNGKNMLYRKEELIYKGCDFSEELVKIANSKGLDVIDGNILNIPFNENNFDFTISIAVIHHISMKKDRVIAVNELIRITKPGGKILILVWAMKQDSDSSIKFSSQDIYLDWKDHRQNILGKRYYHIFKENELEELVNEFNSVKIYKSFYEKGNYGIILVKNE
tara:strand:- start:288 stop:920 length:633 start_codon:yes stop_codon:yes gene_type:complete